MQDAQSDFDFSNLLRLRSLLIVNEKISTFPMCVFMGSGIGKFPGLNLLCVLGEDELTSEAAFSE